MQTPPLRSLLRAVLGLFLGLGLASAACAAPLNDHAALAGMTSAKAIFLIDVNNPGRVDHVLRVIAMTEQGLRRQHVTPHLIVVFVGPDVAFLTRNRRGISYMNERTVAGIQREIAKMHKAGVTFQACGIAMRGMDVNPKTLIADVQPVGNGYISLIGFEHKGYSLVPVY